MKTLLTRGCVQVGPRGSESHMGIGGRGKGKKALYLLRKGQKDEARIAKQRVPKLKSPAQCLSTCF